LFSLHFGIHRQILLSTDPDALAQELSVSGLFAYISDHSRRVTGSGNARMQRRRRCACATERGEFGTLY
jgi:hypothetical protein